MGRDHRFWRKLRRAFSVTSKSQNPPAGDEGVGNAHDATLPSQKKNAAPSSNNDRHNLPDIADAALTGTGTGNLVPPVIEIANQSARAEATPEDQASIAIKSVPLSPNSD